MKDTQFHYRMDPTAPLVFGTGRPMTSGLGGETLPFANPSTCAGAVRAAAARAANRRADPFDEHLQNEVVGAPLLVQCAAPPGGQERETVYLPRPADAVYFMADPSAGTPAQVVPLQPMPVAAGQHCDASPGLLLPTLPSPTRAKPAQPPRWWPFDLMQKWLARERASSLIDDEAHRRSVIADLRRDERKHVVIEGQTKSALGGGLFRTSGIDFGGRRQMLDRAEHERFCIGISTSAGGLGGQPRRVGGEGRLVMFRTAGDPLPCPPSLRQPKVGALIRVVLISPAVFERGGWRPCWIDGHTLQGTVPRAAGNTPQLKLISARIERAGHFSGWQANGPGAPLRVVPAGSVYWFQVLRDLPAGLLWNRSICSDEWAASGWGMCLWGRA